MKIAPPEKVTRNKVVFDVSEIEPILYGPKMQIPPFEPAQVKLKNGEIMVIQPAKLEEAPQLLKFLKKVMEVEHDFYEIVGARVYAEILGYTETGSKIHTHY